MGEFLRFESRRSNHPYIERVWQCWSTGGRFISVSATSSEIVFTRLAGSVFTTLRGPELSPMAIDCPPNGEWLGVRFVPGVFVRHFDPVRLRNRNDVMLPAASKRGFWLGGSVIEYPQYDNVESFVQRLAADGALVRDSIVLDVLEQQLVPDNLRTIQRHFMASTGVTYTLYRQIERARTASVMLQEGMSPVCVVDACGYYDQPHMSRSLRRFIGATATEIASRSTQLSFLYKTEHVPKDTLSET